MKDQIWYCSVEGFIKEPDKITQKKKKRVGKTINFREEFPIRFKEDTDEIVSHGQNTLRSKLIFSSDAVVNVVKFTKIKYLGGTSHNQ